MPVYDCGDPLCEACRREFGPDRSAAIEERKRKLEMPITFIMYRRDNNGIYNAMTGKPIFFFSAERDAQMCMTLMEAVAR